MGMCQLAHEILAKYRAIISAGCRVCFFGFMPNEEVILVELNLNMKSVTCRFRLLLLVCLFPLMF